MATETAKTAKKLNDIVRTAERIGELQRDRDVIGEFLDFIEKAKGAGSLEVVARNRAIAGAPSMPLSDRRLCERAVKAVIDAVKAALDEIDAELDALAQ